MRNETKRNQPPVLGPNRGNRFAETEYAKDISWTLKRIGSYFAKEKKLIFGMLAAVLGGTLCGIYAPILQSNAVDIIAGQRNGDLKTTLALMLAAYLFISLLRLAQGVFSARLSLRIVKQFREELFGKVIDLPIKYTDTHSHGDVMSRMTNDVENISVTVSQALPSLFSGVLTIIGTAAIMLWLCWQLALLSCASILLTVIATRLLSNYVRKYSKERQTLLGSMNGTVEEIVNGYRTVVAYNEQEHSSERFCTVSDKLTKAGIRTEVCSGIMGPLMNCIGNIGFVVIAAFGGYFAIHGLISVGVISAFIVYAKQFSRPINEIAQIYGQLQSAIAGAERVFQVLDETSEDLYGLVWEDDENVTVRFEDVQFGYNKDKPVLKDFNLTIPAGKKVALVGSTGSGKSTVVNLLMRYYDIDKGAIWINDQNVEEITRDSLRKHVAIVLQDTVLFSDTIRRNLQYANETATEAEIKKAAAMSRCHEMIELLPQGYDTLLTGAGENISQGQRQLLAIARAFVANPRILILDEATSNVDTRTEKAIQDAMQQVMKGRTSIVIAHRLSTIRDADLIVVLDQGRIVEQGSHEELLARRQKYYELYMTQYAGFAT
ncbi:MAG: ABC transporter ATP-binding protein [Succiniclasticum sp.]|uniref:ABC transporter ATP-binding protein n=1 Tax=Succiniclasticum sp. TaxID=2775030 RepID=UPI002A91410D|nr:ABC transporter ATP-binding protein [Succiniclasticum sp.]MDY6290088.1 ABC transporter ATP-binding protein [Succiniclasticum sp.]